jgi:hypothetical protein
MSTSTVPRSLALQLMRVLDRRAAVSPSPEEKELFRLANAAVAFLSFSGQLYRFEEFRKESPAGHERAAFFADAKALLERTRMGATSSEEKELLVSATDALDFTLTRGPPAHGGLLQHACGGR